MTARNTYLLRKYGITETQYEAILQKQGGGCGVCRRSATVFGRALAVDHNHQTGEIRGLLCTHCNLRVIGRHKDPGIFLAAADYLRVGTGWFVPKKTKKRKRRVLRSRKS